MLCIEVRQTEFFTEPLEVVERGSSFLQSHRLNSDRQKFLVSPDRDRAFLQFFVADGDLIKIIFDGQEVAAFLTVVYNCVRRILRTAVDTDETIHGLCIWC